MTKILMMATYGDFLATFELSNIKLWQELGCEVHAASNFVNEAYNLKTNRLDNLGVIRHEIDFERSPFKTQNLVSCKKLVDLIQKERFDVIDCHNAVIGAFARLAGAYCHVSKVIYTPHSFFFYNGCPKKNELIFKPVETWLSRKTDLLIAINCEDYQAAKKMKVRGTALYVPGVGVDTSSIISIPTEREKYRQQLGIPSDAQLFISVGELISRKNHSTAIRAFAEAGIPNAYYIICGIGEKKDELNDLIHSLNAQNYIKLLGYRLDVKNLMKASDVFVFPSVQEGLPVALMEAMAAGLPCIASQIRGNVDLISPGVGGDLFSPMDSNELTKLMTKFSSSQELRAAYGAYNTKRVREFDIRHVQDIMRNEYDKLIKEIS